MTLGGMTIAIGALVDDAIIDVENVLRRLRESRGSASALEVVYQATSEVRGAILFATLIIAVVFVPLLLLPGIEGRLLRPLGFAYIGALAASFVVSLTVTPVLCSLLLPESRALEKESRVLGFLERIYRRTLAWTLPRRGLVIGLCAVLLGAALSVVPSLDRSFLPPFNEGSLTIGVTSAPGITLAESDRLGRQVEETLLTFPEVVSTSRRTGRAEKDEHVQGINRSELEVVLRPGRPKEELLAQMRRAVATIPGVAVEFGQPISHRIDHMISGSRTNLAVKIFGPDLAVLRALGAQVEEVLAGVDDIVDLSNQEQATVPMLLVDFDRAALARYGVSTAELSTVVEAFFQGAAVGEIFDDGLVSKVTVRLPERLRHDRERLAALPVLVEGGERIPLGHLADVRFDLGPSLVRRENAQRVAVLTANVVGTDLSGSVGSARQAVQEAVGFPEGYRIVFGGQFEEADRSFRRLALLAVLIVLGMYGLLYLAFRSHRDAAIVSVNLPLSLIGGVLAIWVTRTPLSVATLVGFVTLFGVATRNGVLLVTRYQALTADGATVIEAVERGSIERLAPILMTALTAGLALVPLVLAGSEPGNEIQSPMGIVIIGGLFTSTLLNLVVVPVLFARWGGQRRIAEGL
jgi:CzcA family heavy metal efflux pump